MRAAEAPAFRRGERHGVLWMLDHEGIEAEYVEGYAGTSGIGIPFEHAWIEYRGMIYDPTWVLRSFPLSKTHYRATYRVSAAEIKALIYEQPPASVPASVQMIHFPLLVFHSGDKGGLLVAHAENCKTLFVHLEQGKKAYLTGEMPIGELLTKQFFHQVSGSVRIAVQRGTLNLGTLSILRLLDEEIPPEFEELCSVEEARDWLKSWDYLPHAEAINELLRYLDSLSHIV